LVLREVTERPEAVESGWAKVVGTSREEILRHATTWLKDETPGSPISKENPFGDGKASARIVNALQQFVPKAF
jgi:UDP-N-acetylglucosamine 2-epimerase (non-hydrolysing)